jgi:Alkaline and neutral invertase
MPSDDNGGTSFKTQADMTSDDNDAISSKTQSDALLVHDGADSSKALSDATSAATGACSSKTGSDTPSVDDAATSSETQPDTHQVKTVIPIEEVSKIADKVRANLERHKSCDVHHMFELSPMLHPVKSLEKLRISEQHLSEIEKNGESRSNAVTPKTTSGLESDPFLTEAWKELRNAVINCNGEPVGTIAALDTAIDSLNYDQVLLIIFFFSFMSGKSCSYIIRPSCPVWSTEKSLYFIQLSAI